MPARLRRAQYCQRDRRGQHEQRADERVDHELDDGAHALVSLAFAPHAGEEEERDQHQVEERDEQREILCQQRAEDERMGEAQMQEELALAAPLAAHRPERRRREQDRRQQDQEQVQPVDRELVVNPELADPHLVRDVLKPAARLRVDDEDDRVAERAERPEGGEPTCEPGAARQHTEQRERRRSPEHDRQVDGHCEGSLLTEKITIIERWRAVMRVPGSRR